MKKSLLSALLISSTLPLVIACSFEMKMRNYVGGGTRGGDPTDPGTPSPSPTPTVTATPTVAVASCVSTAPPNGTAGSTANDTTSPAHWFSPSFFLNQSVKCAAVDSQSDTIITRLAQRGGWGNNNIFQIDFSIDVYYTDSSTVRLPFFNGTNYYAPDSDVPSTVPVPPNGGDTGFESANGTLCDGGDCHYIAVDRANKKLYEIYQAEIDSANGTFNIWSQGTGSMAIWDFQKTFGPSLRGDPCTSADAGGLTMGPMLFSAEEVAAGAINHAIRFILPNARIESLSYVRPATHSTGGSGWVTTGDGVPYGARFRLKSTYDLSKLPNDRARVVARALQEYGMILSDGGSIALTAKSDKNSTVKWSSLLGPRDLQALKVTDFEMVEGGQRLSASADCIRAP